MRLALVTRRQEAITVTSTSPCYISPPLMLSNTALYVNMKHSECLEIYWRGGGEVTVICLLSTPTTSNLAARAQDKAI